MSSKADLLASLIEQQKALTEETAAVVDDHNNELMKADPRVDTSNENGQEYVYWARRGEFETAGEVEVCSSTGSENQEQGGYF